MTDRHAHLSARHYGLLFALLGLPLALLIARGTPAGPALRTWLDLTAVSPELQRRLGYILFVPLGALIVVLVRMTLGIRLMGPFRAILLAVALHLTGVALGLAFLSFVTGVMVAIRPVLRRMNMPYYARVSFMLGAVSGLVLMIVIGSSWFRVEALQRVVFFPIVVLCLTGDGFARTLQRDGLKVALWRGGATALAAVLINAVTRVPLVTETLLRAPELVVLQLGLIVFIGKFLNLRLLEGMNPSGRGEQTRDAASQGTRSPGLKFWTLPGDRGDGNGKPLRSPKQTPQTSSANASGSDGPEVFRVAVVRNRNIEGVIARFGQQCPEVYGRRTVQSVLDALRTRGLPARVFEADMTLLDELQEYLGPRSCDDRPRGLVFNMAYGIQGECRYTHVPGMLEMAGIPYTGANPLGHAVSLDKVVAKVLMASRGVPTPRYAVLASCDDDPGDLRYPLVVKPRHESTSYGLRVVHGREELREAVRVVLEQFQQDALVEEFIAGREVCIGLLGNTPVETLPIVELDFRGRASATMTWEDKFHKRDDEPQKLCPAPLDEATAARLRRLAVDTFQACFCKDYARVDIRIDAAGHPYVLEVNSMASLGGGASFVLAAQHAGYDFPALVARIVDTAHRRYFGEPAPAWPGPGRTRDPISPAADGDSDTLVQSDHLRPVEETLRTCPT